MINTKIVRSLITALALMTTTLAVGIIGFHVVEDYSFLDAIYMTFITMSTVGYEVLGDGGLSPEGKVFIIILIIFSLSTFTYAITTVTTFVVEGEIRKLVKGYRVNKEINKLRDHIVICGLGRNGRQAALELMEAGVPFVIIEMNPEVSEAFLVDHPGALIIMGDATDEHALVEANIHLAKGVITALSNDANNVYATLTIRQLNPDVNVVARADNESTISKLEVAGANHVILPNVLGGRKMAKLLTRPALMHFVDLITGQGPNELNLEQIDCEKNPQLIGKTLRELNIRQRTGVLVLGLQDSTGKFQLNPAANEKIEASEKLFIIGTETQIQKFRSEFT
ncbi:MAG: potassium channel protein [Bacteroidota bacterium]